MDSEPTAQLCECGCGEPAPISPYSYWKQGYRKGEPRRFRKGHNQRVTVRRGPQTDLPPPNPSGLCMCGCGQMTALAICTHSARGIVMDQHNRFVSGHTYRTQRPYPAEEARLCDCGCGGFTHVHRGRARRFIIGHNAPVRHITVDDFTVEEHGFATPCWIWLPLAPVVSRRGVKVLAYRAMYEQEIGAIPEGLVIDHLCRQRRCIRPSHLEAVSQAENVRRGRAAKLTIASAREIRRLHATGIPQRALADRFGIGKTTVGSVIRGDAWREH